MHLACACEGARISTCGTCVGGRPPGSLTWNDGNRKPCGLVAPSPAMGRRATRGCWGAAAEKGERRPCLRPPSRPRLLTGPAPPLAGLDGGASWRDPCFPPEPLFTRCTRVRGQARASAEQEMSDRKRYRLQVVPVGSSGTASGATPPATCVWAASASASALRGDSQAFLMLMEPGGQDFQPSSGLALPLSCRAGGDPRPDRRTVGEDSWAWPQLLIRAPARGLSTWCGQNRLVFANPPPSPWPPCCHPVSEEAVTACPPSRSETETLPLSGKRVTPLGHVL